MKKRYSLGIATLVVAVMINVCFLVFRIMVTSKMLFNSDGATTSLYAEEILRTGQLFPPGWGYNNDDVWLYNHTLIVVPLLKILSNGYTTYYVSTILMAFVILVGVGLGLRMLGAQSNAVLALTAILASGVSSPFIADLLYDWGGTYGSQFLLAFVQLVLVARIVQRADQHMDQYRFPVGTMLLLCLIIFISSLSNPSRAFMYHFIPYVLGLALLWFQQGKTVLQTFINIHHMPNIHNRYVMTIMLFILLFFAGTYCHYQIGGTARGGLSHPSLYGADSLASHIIMVVTSWLFFTGYPTKHPYNLVGVGIKQLSMLGAYYSLRIVIACSSIVYVIIFIRQTVLTYVMRHNRSIISVVPTVGFLVAGFFHLTSFRYPTADDYTSIRYLFVPFALMGTVSVVIFKDSIEYLLDNYRNILILSTIVVVVGFMNHVFPAIMFTGGSIRIQDGNPNLGLVACLQREGLHYGYGSFWSSNNLTILSDSSVKVRPVNITKRSIDVFPIHRAASWYDPVVWRGKSFLLLSDAETRLLDKTWLSSNLGKSDRAVTCERFTILEYSYNISRRLFGNLENVVLDLDQSIPHTIGAFDDASGEMTARPGEVGYVMYGPYIPAKRGQYEALVRVYSPISAGRNPVAGVVDIVANQGNTILAKSEITAGTAWQELTLRFDINVDVKDLEVRVYSNGRGLLRVRGPVEIRNVSPSAGDRS